MKITTNAGSYLDVKVIDYSPSILINYELIETSSRKLKSVDRGSSSDRYECKFTFRGKADYIQSIIVTLNELRDNNKQIVLTDIDEKFFGEHVNHTIPINCVVSKMGDVSSPVFNIYTVDITLLSTGVSFVGGPAIPSAIQCLQSNWSGTSEWNTKVNETYFRTNYFVDHVEDIYTFKGSYIMSNDQVRGLYMFWQLIRGGEFVITDGVWGAFNMFGFDNDDTEHTVVITNIEYEIMSSQYKRVTIELTKVG